LTQKIRVNNEKALKTFGLDNNVCNNVGYVNNVRKLISSNKRLT